MPERGSIWLRNFVTSQQITISELALFESATVLRRRYLEGAFSRTQSLALLRRVRINSASYQIIGLGGIKHLDNMIGAIFNLPATLGVRALDAIQLEAALITFNAANSWTPAEPFVFVSSDRQLLQVAQAQGFVTENPESYP